MERILYRRICNERKTLKAKEAAGIEREDLILQRVLSHELTTSSAEVSALCLHEDRPTCQSLAANDNELIRVIELWPSLPEAAQRSIYSLCIAAASLND